MADVPIAAELEALAERISRLRQGHRDPHRFFEDRSEAAHDARSLAEWLRTGRPPADYVPADKRSP